MARNIEDVKTEEQLIDAVAAMSNPEKYTWSADRKLETQENAVRIINFIRQFDARQQ